ncbi:LacI family transcriptional regulator [Thermotoga sp. 38H-to]|nr:LacI family transcriptional regulator [Thermotoga sp. 38H-to]
MKGISLKDIAQRLNVSVSTVSRALNGKPGVSKRLREKIIKLAEELGYTPNPLAIGLKSGTTKLVGILVPELKGDFFALIVESVERALYHLGYRLLLCPTEDDPKKEEEHLKILVNQKVEGILSAPANFKENKELYEVIINEYKIPVVFFDRLVEGIETDYVISDNSEGMKLLMDYLISRGHKKIGFIHPLRGIYTSEIRLKTFLEYKDKIVFKEEWLIDGKSSEEDAREAFLNLMRSKERPTAVIIGSYHMTLGCLRAAKEMALKIPEDVSIVSFDDAPWNEIFEPPITCVSQDPREIGLIAATILLNKLKNKKHNNTKMQIVLKVKFLKRLSVSTIK